MMVADRDMRDRLKELVCKKKKFRPWLTVPKELKPYLQGKFNLLYEKSVKRGVVDRKKKKKLSISELKDVSSINKAIPFDNTFTVLDKMSPLYTKKNTFIDLPYQLQASVREYKVSNPLKQGVTLSNEKPLDMKKRDSKHYRKLIEEKIVWDHDVFDIYNPSFSSDEEALPSIDMNLTAKNLDQNLDISNRNSKDSGITVKAIKNSETKSIRKSKLKLNLKKGIKTNRFMFFRNLKTFQNLPRSSRLEVSIDKKVFNTSADLLKSKVRNNDKFKKRASEFSMKLHSMEFGAGKGCNKPQYAKRNFQYTKKLIKSYNFYKNSMLCGSFSPQKRFLKNISPTKLNFNKKKVAKRIQS